MAPGARAPHTDPRRVGAIVGGVQLDVAHPKPDVRHRVGNLKARGRRMVERNHGEALVDQRLIAGLAFFRRGP